MVRAGSGGSIVDASGNTWTITSAGQVAVNGQADTSTGNVIALAYVNGTVWQEVCPSSLSPSSLLSCPSNTPFLPFSYNI
jgi:hypothetical protein